MKFPVDYPYSPPKLRFLTPILHPNVYTVSSIESLNTFTHRNTSIMAFLNASLIHNGLKLECAS